MALTSAFARIHALETDTLHMPVAAGATIYPGGLVCSDANGYAVPADDAADHVFEGMAMQAQDANGGRLFLTDNVIDNSAGDDGDIFVLLQRRGYLEVDVNHVVTQALMSALCYVIDDNTVAVGAEQAVNDVPCGRVCRILSATRIVMSIDCYTHCAGHGLHEPVSTTTGAPTTTTAGA